jgi:ATP-dependent Lon protease
MNQHFQDRFYSSSIEFDLSGVLIVFSYNNSEKLDPILLDRIKEIHISAYTTQEKISIGQNYIMKELCESIGFDRNKIHFDDSVIKYIIEKYTLEAGARELRRKLEQILLKLNIDRFYMRGPFRKLMHDKYLELHLDEKSNIDIKNEIIELDELSESKKESLSSYVEYKKSKLEDVIDDENLNKIFNLEFDGKIIITQGLIHRYLDKPTMIVEKIHKNDLVGVINGLYATAIGMGGIVPIQIYKNYIGSSAIDDSNFKLKLTGNQKQVMRESVICALTSSINILNVSIRDKILNVFPHGFHVHAPDGGTPKDGPSAGCAFATAFISILLGKKINKYVAMTGEIELTGKVSKIGGLDAKLAGAKKSGIKRVYICEENKEDYENFEIKIISHIIDIVTDPYVIVDINISDFDPIIIAEHLNKKLIN